MAIKLPYFEVQQIEVEPAMPERIMPRGKIRRSVCKSSHQSMVRPVRTSFFTLVQVMRVQAGRDDVELNHSNIVNSNRLEWYLFM